MFLLKAVRNGSKLEQVFQTLAEANAKAKELAKMGFSVEVPVNEPTRVRVPNKGH